MVQREARLLRDASRLYGTLRGWATDAQAVR